MAQFAKVHPTIDAGTSGNDTYRITIITELLLAWNRVLYYSLALPYKIVLRPTGKAVLLYSRGRMVLMSFLAALRICYLWYAARLALGENSIQQNPTILYTLAVYVAQLIFTASWMVTMSKTRLEKLREGIEWAGKSSLKHRVPLKEKCGPIFLLLVPLLIIVALTVLPLVEWCSTQGCHVLYLNPELQALPLARWMKIEPLGNLWIQYAFSVVAATTHVVTHTHFWMAVSTTSYMAIVVVYLLGKAGEKYLQKNGEILNIRKIYAFHMELYQFMDCVNVAFSPAVLSILALFVLYASTFFLVMLHMETLNARFAAYLDVWECGLLVLAAYSVNKLRNTIILMQRKGREGTLPERHNAHLLLTDMKDHPVVLKAFIFTINSNLLCTVFTSILTYVIIKIQFSGTPVKQEG